MVSTLWRTVYVKLSTLCVFLKVFSRRRYVLQTFILALSLAECPLSDRIAKFSLAFEEP